MTTKEAADKLGMRQGSVISLIKRGHLNATKLGRDWAVFDDAKFKSYTPGKAGRPRKSELRCPDERCGRTVEKMEDGRYQCIRCKKVWNDNQIKKEN